MPRAKAVLEGANDLTLVFERPRPRQMNLEGQKPDRHALEALHRDLLDHEELEDVAFLEVVEVRDADAALEP